MPMHPSVADRLAGLAPDQRAAATAAPGPVLVVAPAGSGKTTTLVARIAWFVDGGVPADTIAAITFNRRGIFENLAYQSASNWTYSNNILTQSGAPTTPAMFRERLKVAPR